MTEIISKVNINSPRGSSLITSIPKTVREMLSLNNKDTLLWSVKFVDDDWVACVKLKKD